MRAKSTAGIQCADEAVARARAGDAASLHSVLESVQAPIYALAIRMLADPEHARDATQDALIRIARGLPEFRADASFSTWVYRVALNVLLTTVKRDAETRLDPVLIEETKLFCTHGMLLCLDREQRATYILGEILEVPGETVAAVLGVSQEAFRKRLSRARASMSEFMRARCGLVNGSARCRCEKLTSVAVPQKLISPDRLRYATHPTRAERSLKRTIAAYAAAITSFGPTPTTHRRSWCRRCERSCPTSVSDRMRGGRKDTSRRDRRRTGRWYPSSARGRIHSAFHDFGERPDPGQAQAPGRR